MTGRERILTALRRGQPDRVPIWELIVNEPTLSALAGPGATAFDFAERMDLDGITIFENQRLEPSAGGHIVTDEWGITWGISDVGIPYPVAGPIAGERDPSGSSPSGRSLDTYRPPDPGADWRLTTLEAAIQRFGGERAVVFLTHDAFEFASNLYGMENVLAGFALDPHFVHRLFRTVIEYKKAVLERACAMGADAIVAGDDYASRRGPIMSPAHFREFVKPYLREIVEVAHRHGKPFIKHTDGNIWPLLDDLLDTGVDALDPLEPIAGMDIGEVKRAVGQRAAVVGNVDCSVVLTRGAAEQVVEAVKETIAKGSPGGGHILASSNSIHPAVKPENYRAMVEAGRRFGAYPLDQAMVAEYRTRSYIAPYLDTSPP